MGLLKPKRDKYEDKLIADMSDKQRKDKAERLEEQRDDVVRRIEKLMVRISKEMKNSKLRERPFPLGNSPNDRDLDEYDYKMAALYNNMSSAFSDLGERAVCEECCFKAIEILEHNAGCNGEIAVTLVNLAHLYHEEDPFDERIYEFMDKAWELLISDENEQDGNFAFLCSKCAPSFGFFGYFEKEAELKKLTEKIYALS